MKRIYKVLACVVSIVVGWLLLVFGFTVSGHPLLAGVSFISGLCLLGGGVLYIIIVCSTSDASTKKQIL